MLRKRGSNRIMISIVAWTIVASGCAGGATVREDWMNPAFTAHPMQDVLVVAVRGDGTMRRVWEDAFVHELSARGVRATPSHELFKSVPAVDQVLQAVDERHFATILYSAPIGAGTPTATPAEQDRTVPHSVFYTPGTAMTGRYDVEVGSSIPSEHSVQTSTERVRTDVWEGKSGGELIWSGTLEIGAQSNAGLIQGFASDRVAPELEKRGLVPKRGSH